MDDALSIASLPDDPAILKQLLGRERDEHQSLKRRHAELEQAKQQIELEKLRLEMELLRFKKWYYGPRADRLQHSGEVAQMLLEFAVNLESRPVHPQDLPADMPAAEVVTVRRVRRGRRNLADFQNLPVVRHMHDLAEADKACPCCGNVRQKIGEEVNWQIERIPSHFERVEHVRIKYACKHCEQSAAETGPQIVLADKPVVPIDKGLAGPGLLAYVVTSKFSDYLPLYRLQHIFQRNGFEIDRATLSVWCGDVADLIQPLYDLMVQRVLQSHVICTDDTVMPMQAPGKAMQSRMWVYVGDAEHPYNIFDFTLGRSRDGPAKFLGRYDQVLLADAYGGYDGVVVGNDIIRAGCMAHCRRKFVDAEKSHPQIAAAMVAIIKQLYAVEEQGKMLDAIARLALRQEKSRPILVGLKERLLDWKQQLLPKHPMAEAIGYTLNQWAELNVFTSDGAVPLDNNISEREMKRIVLNRKNSLFVGHLRGGQTAAILSSITSTCRRHNIDPERYLTQLLINLPATPISQLSDWLPDQWKLRNSPPSE